MNCSNACGVGPSVTASTVTVHVRRLREKVEQDPTHPERLVTVWGVGYIWQARGHEAESEVGKWADQFDIITVAATAALAVGIGAAGQLAPACAITAVAFGHSRGGGRRGAYVGLIAITQQMFISSHDLTVATYVGSVAALVTLIVALGLGSAIGRWSARCGPMCCGWVRGRHRGPGRVPAEFRDLTQALHEAEQELTASRERERLLDQSRRDLVSWVSHDLRTPLAGLLAMTEALEDGMRPTRSAITVRSGGTRTAWRRWSTTSSNCRRCTPA